MITKLVILIMSATLGRCGPAPAPATAADEAEAATAAPAVVLALADPPPRVIHADPETADDLLARLERSASDLRDFQAGVTYWKWDSVLERDEIRQGEVVYQVDPVNGTKRFAILLERLIVGNRARTLRKHYVFDGTWLVEIDHDSRMFIKRQIVPPGKRFDPLKLGEGPFPLPIGQTRDEVRARFEVERLDRPRNETLAKRLSGKRVDGLRLVPKPHTPQAKDIREVEIFYDAATLLPVGISLREIDGDRKTVVLQDVQRNAGVDAGKLSIEEPDPAEWHIDVQPWPQ